MSTTEQMRTSLIGITSDLVGMRTAGEHANVSICTPYLTDKMQALGMEVQVMNHLPGEDIVLGTVGAGDKSLVIACHMDTVEAGKGWQGDPFQARVKGDKIIGRGAIDDKGPFAVAYCAVQEFLSTNPEWNGKIHLVTLPDEEFANQGVIHLLESGFRADAALIPDGGYLDRVDYGEKGCIQVIIRSNGLQEHSALQENGRNAVENLVVLLHGILGGLTFDKFDHRFSPLKVNISRFGGGDLPNTVPAKAEAQLDIRYPYGVTPEEVLVKLDEIMAADYDRVAEFAREVLYITEPHVVDDEKLVQLFVEAAGKIGMPMEAITLAGNSVGKEFTQHSIPALVHYPSQDVPAHEPEEFIKISEMMQTIQLYVQFLRDYFSAD